MINWLIKKLGGFTAFEVEKAEIAASDLVQQIERQTSFLMEQIQLKDKEIARLTNLVLTRAGFVVTKSQQEEKEPPQAINKRPSWRATQKRLEQEDARRAADQIERSWRNKPGAVPIGDGIDEGVSSEESKSVG